MLILIVDRNCIFILSILYMSILVGLYLGAGGTYISNDVGVNSNVLGLQTSILLHRRFLVLYFYS